jgi:hypothetical protein
VTEPLPRAAKGDRPTFFDDPAVDALVTMVLELAREQWVLRHRLAVLEDYVERKDGSLGAVERHTLPAEATAALDAQRTEFVARLFRAVER